MRGHGRRHLRQMIAAALCGGVLLQLGCSGAPSALALLGGTSALLEGFLTQLIGEAILSGIAITVELIVPGGRI